MAGRMSARMDPMAMDGMEDPMGGMGDMGGGMDPSMMFGQPEEIIDDAEILEASHHALDVPQDWADANPVELDMGVPAGTGYAELDGPGMGSGMGGPMDFSGEAGLTPEEGPEDIEALKEAMFSQLSGDADRSSQYQEGVEQDNLADRKKSKMMNY